MKSPFIFVLVVAIVGPINAFAQKKETIDIYGLALGGQLKAIHGQSHALKDKDRSYVHFDETEGDDLAWLTGRAFSNGTIELDIRGREEIQKSFVGIAFHGADENTMDIVYFRPFNFQSADSIRRIHAVQYVSAPDFDWKRLRDEKNGMYEKAINPAPSGKDWFHAKIVIHYPHVTVFVNGNQKASLTVDKLNTRKTGKIGLWVGPASGGDFANLSIKDE